MKQKTEREKGRKGEREKRFFSPAPLLPCSPAIRSHILRLTSYILLLVLPFAFAVTYRVDPTNGPETLATEVKEAFDAWVALSEKIEVEETEENPEGIFQYGATERFGPDTLSLTVQRQADTRSLIYLISPNAENRKRILLHETGIAIGLTPQIPGTPLPTTPTPTPTEETPTEEDGETLEPEPSEISTDTQTTEESTTEEQQSTEEQFTTEEQTTDEQATTEEQSTDEQTTQEQTTEEPSTTSEEPSESSDTTDTTSTESGTESTGEETSETTDTSSTESTDDSTTETSTDEEPTETPEPALTPNSVMNPSISPDDSTELGDFERQLVENLQLFVSQDINRDGVVNFYDLVALSQAFGRRDVNDPADINRDGVVDQSDVDELQSVYAFSDPSETAPGSSPEEETDGTTDETTPPEETLPDGTLPEDLPPPQEDGTLQGDGSGE